MNANSYDTPGRAGGDREDLRNILTILEPEETPFTSMCKKGPAPISTLVEVLADTLRPARKTGSKEGQDAGKGNNKAKNRQRFGTYVHRAQDEYGVTDVQQLISKRGGAAAISNEYADDKAKTVRELKRDMEAVNCSTQDHSGGSDGDMITRGAFCWLDPQGGSIQTTAPTVPLLFRTPSGNILSGVGSPASFSEAQLYSVLQNLFAVYGGKKTYDCIAGQNIISVVDNFTRVQPSAVNNRYQVRQDADTLEINLEVHVFDCSFGKLNMLPTMFNNVNSSGIGDQNAALINNMDLWEMDFLDPLHAVDQEENSGGQSGYAKVMWALLNLNPKGSGKIYNTGA